MLEPYDRLRDMARKKSENSAEFDRKVCLSKLITTGLRWLCIVTELRYEKLH